MKSNALSRSLPQYQGPKLAPFAFQNPAEPRVEILNEIGSGLHSTVYRGRIDGKLYAVKVFCFWGLYDLIHPTSINLEHTSLEDLFYELDPFYAECRAYGRLKETDNEKLAIKCYGYTNIPYEQELELDPDGQIFHRDAIHKPETHPLRAIVKELLTPGSPPFTFSMIPQMKRDLTRLHKIGLTVYDLRAGNYMNGKIIDFSQAHTSPHHCLDLSYNGMSGQVTEICARDFQAFDEMMNLWMDENPGQQVWDRFLPNQSYGSRLRNQDRYKVWFEDSDCIKYDAALYDWKAAERNRNQIKTAKSNLTKPKTRSGAVKKKKRKKATRR